MTSQPQVTVEQVDREAAADWYEIDDIHGFGAALRTGKGDDDALVQAFARHRLLGVEAGLEKAAVIADRDAKRGESRHTTQAGVSMRIATAIRQAKEADRG